MTKQIRNVADMVFKSILLGGAALLAASGAAYASQSCAYTATQNTTLNATGLTLAQILVHDSDVQLTGVKGLTQIQVAGKVCASSPERLKSYLSEVHLDTTRSGNTATITVDKGHEEHFKFGVFSYTFSHSSSYSSPTNYAYVKLVVQVPASLATQITSESGDISADNLASLIVKSQSGDIEANHIQGLFSANSASGDISAQDLGSAALSNVYSGDVELKSVQGNVSVGTMESGDLSIENVQHDVTINNMNSGDVTLSKIAGSVNLNNILSGDVIADDIGGNFTVQNSISGNVVYHNVHGTVSVPGSNN